MADAEDLKTTVANLAKAVAALQVTAEANANTMEAQEKAIIALSNDRSSTSGYKAHFGEPHQDRPPKFQKMDFPRCDGKSDLLVFINRCESYFHQQRIMEEEKVWMASYNLEEGAQMWYIQVQTDEGTPSWRDSRSFSTSATGRRSDRPPWLSLWSVAARLWSPNIRTDSRPCSPGLVISTSPSGCSSSLGAFCRHSASTCRSKTRRCWRSP